jgi:RND family efflux transporter MFP subunit
MALSRWSILLAGTSLSLVTAGCTQPNQYQPPPPPTVTVAQPVQKTVTNYLEETGTTEAVAQVEVRARVKGFIERVNFQPGSEVKQGDSLYKIEPELFQAQVAAAKADLMAQQALRDKAKIERDRQANLQKQDPGATSEVAVVAARAEYEAAEAGVQAAQAALDQAELDLAYTEVTAPISGRVGKTLVKEGNLVGDGEATHLTDIVNYDPIYANFSISERSLLELRKRQTADDQQRDDQREYPVYLQLATDQAFPHEGRLDYADLAVNQSTGTFSIRGIFPNPSRQIVPGLFVRVRLPIGQQPDALLVPERATAADQAGTYVYVVNEEDTVERRDISLGTKDGDLVVVSQGLQPDEWVLIDGLQRARPGAKVQPDRTQLTPPEEE